MKVELRSNDVVLRPFSVLDKELLSTLMSNPSILKNLRDSIPNPYTVKDAENFISYCSTCFPVTTFAVEYRGELVGCIGLVVKADVQRLSAELGYWIGEPYWNRGIATLAISLIVEYAFKHLGLIRIFSEVFDFNLSSQKVLQKAGFTFSCILEKAAIKDGTVCSMHLYSIVSR